MTCKWRRAIMVVLSVLIIALNIIPYAGMSAAQASAFAGSGVFQNGNIVLAETRRMERRDDRRDDRGDRRDDRGERRDTRQDCRQEEGLVGGDKRDCKQEGPEESGSNGSSND
jgi:hypothetical protein